MVIDNRRVREISNAMADEDKKKIPMYVRMENLVNMKTTSLGSAGFSSG